MKIDKARAKLTVRRADQLTSTEVDGIAAWLTEQAKFLKRSRGRLSKRYTAKYMQVRGLPPLYPDSDLPPLCPKWVHRKSPRL